MCSNEQDVGHCTGKTKQDNMLCCLCMCEVVALVVDGDIAVDPALFACCTVHSACTLDFQTHGWRDTYLMQLHIADVPKGPGSKRHADVEFGCRQGSFDCMHDY